MKIIVSCVLFFVINCFHAQEMIKKDDCSENIRLQKKNVEDFVLQQQKINYQILQNHILKIFKKTNFDAEILLFLNADVTEGEGPRTCPVLDFPEYREYSTSNLIWNEGMLNVLSKTINKTIFPASYNSWWWGKGGFYTENSEEFRFLGKNQINYINKLPLFSNKEYDRIRYIKVKNKKPENLPKNFNQVILRQNNKIVNGSFETEIELTISTKTENHTYNFKYDFDNKDWLLIAEK